ncbi:UvrD-helicase domain-containing protein [Ferrimicrobium sp.]|uniref:UvrD-helicase domain-containing protein n=1 Tax=Ferrimicrobium sp. TaxID=2926050 RepID=UPI0026136A19|nr:UvrD-helicase domain-containing protein [Ferrimicrobium sp.]
MAATDPVVIVMGGAGTGKTTTAAAVVRRELDQSHRDRTPRRRALFLSFSRAAVSQILDRTSGALDRHAAFVEVTTFHAFGWKLVKHFGSAVGLSEPKLISPSEAKLFGTTGGITYDELMPLALRLIAVPAIQRHLQQRWAIIVCDEFQDTTRDQFDLITRIRGEARLLLLGDLNQCIYTNLPGATGVGPERVAAAESLPGAVRIDLPEVSHRDPTNILPAAASAVRRRDFDHSAVQAALDAGMLSTRHTTDLAAEPKVVADVIVELRAEGHETVAIFSHHVDATADLSDALNTSGIGHEIVGLPDAVTSALEAQFEMLNLAAGGADPELVLRTLGVFITSVERGQAPPRLARMIVGQLAAPDTLITRLDALNEALVVCTSVSDTFEIVSGAFDRLGLVRGRRPWLTAVRLLRTLLGPRLYRATMLPADGFGSLREKLTNQQVDLLTNGAADDPAPVQLMGLYQSKGREADATIVVLRENDYYGRETEPMPNGSKLLYVVLTRARKKTIILTFGRQLSPLIRPLAMLGRSGT